MDARVLNNDSAKLVSALSVALARMNDALTSMCAGLEYCKPGPDCIARESNVRDPIMHLDASQSSIHWNELDGIGLEALAKRVIMYRLSSKDKITVEWEKDLVAMVDRIRSGVPS
jgi:hypothetical protein